MKTLKLIPAIAVMLLSFNSNSQNYLGITGSNYGGVMSTDLQPASFVDGRFLVDINLASFSFNTYTNAGSFDTRDMPKWWVKSFKSDDPIPGNSSGLIPGGSNPYNDWMLPDSTIDSRYVTRNYDPTSTKTLGIYNNIQVDFLNFMFHINPKIAVGATARFRSISNVDAVDPKMAVLIENDLDYPSLWNQTFNEELLDVNHMSWMEYGVLYSQVLKDDGEHFLKMGAKLKLLAGYSSAYIHTDNFAYNLINADSSASLSGDFSYGHSAGVLEDGFPESGLPDAASKMGFGGDIGFVYEWRPDWEEYKYDMDGETNIWRRDRDKYKLRAGASILDVGGMKFQKGGLSRDFSVNSNDPFDLHVFDGAGSLYGVDSIIDSLIRAPGNGWNAIENEGSTFFMQLPTAVSFQFDYHIWEWFYVNATGVLNVQSVKNPHRTRIANQISVTPSFDHPWFGVHLPMSFNKYSGFKAGLATRLGPLTVGFTDFKTLFATGKVNGAEIYAGLRVPILYGHPSDIDGDLVSDEVDECLVVPGLWDFKGCPDSDRDGIKDMDDHCPQEAGLLEFNGCPDRDKDGIPDKDDACPELPGDKIWNGCPDRDNDSIIDPQDDCPDTPGIAAFKGCPDTDGDGLKDDEDACPDVPGPIINNGCPDTDSDGLFDFIDECPTIPGPKENNGCPWPDTDEDGLEDRVDGCPFIAGPKENKGCPYTDTDEDGVLDKDDKCPETPGPVANEGCPEIEKEIEIILQTAFDNLEFETGKDIIKNESYPSLTELAEVLQKKPEWKLQIAGHTDNVGNDQNNLVLSKKRAESVKKFMEDNGIESGRLSTLYFGETQPIAPNDTKEGRQKNRRVEMTIIFN